MSTPDPREIAAALGLDAEVMAARMTALGLGPAQLEVLHALAPAAQAQAPQFLDRLYTRIGAVPELAQVLGGPARIAALKRQQLGYLASLFAAPRDEAYLHARIGIGITHHRVGLAPQWFIATYAHFVVEHLPLVFAAAPDTATGVRWSVVLLRAVLFDATIALDAYGMTELIATRHRADPALPHPGDELAMPGALASVDERTRSFTRTQLTSAEVDLRAAFIGIEPSHRALIASMRAAWSWALPRVLDDFYALFSSRPETEALVPPDVVPRLKAQVHSYWEEFGVAAFDRPYAASRRRVGIVHERIGLSPQWYLVGLAVQCEGLLWSAAAGRDDAPALVDAFVRGLVFDVTYVLDAYMEARAQTLLRTEGYANQLVQGLSAGVLIVDGARRVVSVNRALIGFLGIDPALLYGVPAVQAVNLPEIGPLLERVDAGHAAPQVQALGAPPRGDRVATVVRHGARVFRVTAMALDPWAAVKGRPVALLFDDISDLVRVSGDSEHMDARMAALVQSLDATVWELDVPSWTLELVSASVLTLTGYRDVYFVGRRDAWVECVHAADRERFRAHCETLPVGGRGTLEHRIVRADGQLRWVRTMLRSAARDAGASVLFGVTMDITHERLAEQRQRERDVAEASSRAKSDLLATMSHDIRTPLNGVIGMLDYLLGSRLDPEAVAHVRTAQQSALDLLELLNDILDVAKLEAGRMELHAERFDLVALVESMRDLFAAQAQAKRLALTIEFGRDVASAWVGDVTRLRQVLANLLGNAVKFTAEGGVHLRVAAEPPGLRIEVSDSGVGVPEDKRAALFEPFTQAHVSWGGTGLGLSICRQLAELMGGSVRYLARAEGGSCFVLELPLLPAPAATLPQGEGRWLVSLLGPALDAPLRARLEAAGWRLADAPRADALAYFVDAPALLQELADDASVILCGAQRPELPPLRRSGPTHVLGLQPLNERGLIELLQGFSRAPTAPVAYRGAVLVAEDNAVSQRVVTLMLERLGFDVDVVVNGRLAVDAARRKAYALVLMDMLMPELDGVEASRQIRADGLNRRTPIVALTANVQPEARASALSAGMDDVLLKPVQLKMLSHVLARYVLGQAMQ